MNPNLKLKQILLLAAGFLSVGTAHADETVLGLGERADWMRGSWGALWLPERTYNGNIEGVRIDDFLDQISNLKTLDYVQVALTSPNIYSPTHTGPHPIIESLREGNTDGDGEPLNLVVPRASVDDPLLSWLTAIKASGLKTQIYVNSYNLLARNENIPDAYPDLSARWEEYCDTNATAQAFINNHPYIEAGDPERRRYMFCYAEFILKEYAVRYGDLIDAWVFDSADNIMEVCGDDADSGVLDDQRIYQAFANACHAGNPNAAIAFNNSVGNDVAPFATPTRYDDYAFGHPFGGAGNMVVPEILYTRNFAICEFMSEHNGLPFATTDDRDWNDAVVGHFFPKQSTTSWNAGNTPCLTDEQFVEWTAEGVVNGGAITWGTPLIRTNLENSPVLVLRDYALNQLELADAHLSEFQFPGVPNWRRAETPLPDATIDSGYSHTLTDGFDFWDPAGGSITSLTLVDAPPWLSVAESSPGSGVWVLGGTPTETEATNYCFVLQIAIGDVEASRTVDLVVNEPPIMPTESRTIGGNAVWSKSGLELVYDNGVAVSENRAIRYSSQSFQSDGGFRLDANYTAGNVGNNGLNNFSIGLISDETDLASYAGLNPFAVETNVYSLGVNITANQGVSSRGLNFTDGSSRITLDQSGTNAQFAKDASTPIAIEVGPNGEWSYSIDGIVEATGVLPGGFDLSKNYRVVVYGQDYNGGIKSIQSLALELKPVRTAGLVAEWSLDDVSSGVVTDTSGNDLHGIMLNGSGVSGLKQGALEFNGFDSFVTLPAEAFSSIGNEVTIAMWVFGDTTQPQEDSVLNVITAAGSRVFNIHLPWKNSNVIWDAGTNGGSEYDRVSKRAEPSEFMGRWNHWVFTKNSSTGVMAIYLNGVLWHSDVEKIKPISWETLDASLGTDNAGRIYDGMIDEVKLYNVALDMAEVAELHGAYQGYEAWTSRYPGLGDLELDADGDKDGMSMLQEYIFNGDPLQPDQLVFPQIEASGENYVFSFDRRAESATDTSQVFQYTSNLVDWHDLDITGLQALEVSIGDETGGVEGVTISVPKGLVEGDSCFGRVKADR